MSPQIYAPLATTRAEVGCVIAQCRRCHTVAVITAQATAWSRALASCLCIGSYDVGWRWPRQWTPNFSAKKEGTP